MENDPYQASINHVEQQIEEAKRVGNNITAESYQRELNELRNQQIDAVNMMLNPMIKWYDEKVMQTLTPRPGSVVWTDTTAGSNVVFQKYAQSIDIDDKTYKNAKELDQRRHVKLFAHFAKQFVERFPNWELRPDATDPFNKLILVHKNNKYKIEDTYPSNEVRLDGAPSDYQDKVEQFSNRHGIPPSIFKTNPPTVPTQNFFGWAIGMEDVPDFVRE